MSTQIVATHRSEQNLAMIDPWTVVHFSSGLAAGLDVLIFAVGYRLGINYQNG